MKNEKIWIIRGRVRKSEKDFLEGLRSTVSVIMVVDSFQTGYARACRCAVSTLIELNTLKGAQEKLSSMEFYPGEELVVWVAETTNDKGKKKFSLQKIEEKAMDIMPIGDLLKDCI